MHRIAWSQHAYHVRTGLRGPTLPKAASEAVDEEMLALLRTKGLSIKELGGNKRAELGAFLEEPRLARGMSLTNMAKLTVAAKAFTAIERS